MINKGCTILPIICLKMGDQEALIDILQFKSWSLLDIEYIQVSKHHKCVRKLYLLTGDGKWDMEMEFTPCVPYHFLIKKYQRSFQYCERHIHRLPYRPEVRSCSCSSACGKVKEFIEKYGIEVILYKGGTIERDLCEKLSVESYNIEILSELRKVHSHDPATEVNLYWDQLYKYTL